MESNPEAETPQQHTPPIRKPDNTWAKTDLQKAETFANYLATVFRPLPTPLPNTHEGAILQQLNTPHQMAPPLLKIRVQEVEHIIRSDTHPTKAPGYDLITGKLLKELPRKGIRAVTQMYNAIFRLEYFPCHWKIGQIIMIAKPGKNPSKPTSSSAPIQNPRKNYTETTDTYISSKQCNPGTSIRLPATARYYTTGAPNHPSN
jgi:hypothetical protein